jgi:dihydrofolate synthase/folylpolyglutamate synthase
MNEAMISHDGPGHRFLASLGQRGMELGLSRIVQLLERLGRPQDAFAVIAVAGSDGKGSTSAMLTAILVQAGLRVGHYTSPHLVETRERLLVGDRCVSAESLDQALYAVAAACQTTPALDPTPFEALTAAALWLLREMAVQVAVLEVGLGGRLDAVNATDPVVSLITHLSYDHTAILGDTLPQIAWEKAGIARDGRALICEQPSLVRPALRRHGLTPRVLSLGTDVQVAILPGAPTGKQAVQLSGPALDGPLQLELGLLGRHQADNAALAVLGYLAFAEWWQQVHQQALAPAEELAPVLSQVAWPCRAELAGSAPRVLIDAAHNPAGIAALAQLLGEQGRDWQIVLAVRRDRDAQAIVRAFADCAAAFWLPRCSGPTLLPAAELAAHIDAVLPAADVAVASIGRCLREAKAEALRRGPNSGVAVTGSQHAIGEWLQSGDLQSPLLALRLSK